MSDTYHHGDLQNALLEKAATIVQEEGWDQVTFRRLARETGVSHNAPYRHFSSREALFAALSQRGFEQLGNRLGEAVQRHPEDTHAQLLAFGWQYVAFAIDNPNLYPLMFNRQIMQEDDEAQNPDLLATFYRASEALIGVFRQAQATGYIQAGDPARQALTFWGLLHGLALLWIERQIAPPFVPPGEAADTMVQASIRMLIEGLG